MTERSAQAMTQLQDAIHTLAQPLTALSFTADMALMQASPEVWKAALETVRSETRRAFAALEQVRQAAAEIHAGEN